MGIHCHPPPRDFTSSCTHHQTAVRVWVYPDEPGPDFNRLRTGVGIFGANMLRWGLSMSDSCDCGAKQMADHITSGRCLIYHPHVGIIGK